MVTDPVPKQKTRKVTYDRSDALRRIDLPAPTDLSLPTDSIKAALQLESRGGVEAGCRTFAAIVAAQYGVKTPPVAVLGVRPHRTSGGVCVYEKFGDYDFATTQIRIWMRTAMKGQITSFGTLLSTLCHELCHHLDMVRFDFPGTPHTRGFYERAGLLYHQARNTPVRPLVWVLQRDGTYRIDWGKTMGSR